MKVQTDGLLLDLRTTNPPGPFSPLRPRTKMKLKKKKGKKEKKKTLKKTGKHDCTFCPS